MSKKYSFLNDYSEGAHPKLLDAIRINNEEQEIGYGEDQMSLDACDIIRKKINNKHADIHFITGGTQANLISIASSLQPFESVVAATTAHIAVHEAGAIEATGHKINTIETEDGKLTPELIEPVLTFHSDEHMVKPKLVFISNSTEVGTIYQKRELQTLSKFCKENNLLLYLDGARLGSAITSKYSDLSLEDIASLVDMFYIGGTKNGAIMGEAIIIINDDLKPNFRFHLKQRGALLAKGRYLGAQFLSFFEDNLYFDLANHANDMAFKLAEGIEHKGYKFLTDPQSNQIFPIFPNKLIEKLQNNFDFYIWSKIDDHYSSIRLVTSWATKEEKVEEFLNHLNS